MSDNLQSNNGGRGQTSSPTEPKAASLTLKSTVALSRMFNETLQAIPVKTEAERQTLERNLKQVKLLEGDWKGDIAKVDRLMSFYIEAWQEEACKRAKQKKALDAEVKKLQEMLAQANAAESQMMKEHLASNNENQRLRKELTELRTQHSSIDADRLECSKRLKYWLESWSKERQIRDEAERELKARADIIRAHEATIRQHDERDAEHEATIRQLRATIEEHKGNIQQFRAQAEQLSAIVSRIDNLASVGSTLEPPDDCEGRLNGNAPGGQLVQGSRIVRLVLSKSAGKRPAPDDGEDGRAMKSMKQD